MNGEADVLLLALALVWYVAPNQGVNDTIPTYALQCDCPKRLKCCHR